MIMPSSASESKKTPEVPVITFFGPDPQSQVRAVNTNGVEVARFVVGGTDKEFNICRVTSPNTAPLPICTAKRSSLSGRTELTVQGQEGRLEDSSGMGYYAMVTKLPLGKVTFRKDKSTLTGTRMKLLDENKTIVARCHAKELMMEIYINGDEIMFDWFLSAWVAYVKTKQAGEKSAKVAFTAFKIVGGLAGVGGS